MEAAEFRIWFCTLNAFFKLTVDSFCRTYMQWRYIEGVSQTSTIAATRYNDGNPEARTTQLRNAKVEEAQIGQMVKSRFENLTPEIQGKLNNVQ
jgi:hypothetical protein